jgi:prephenate dehydrogenase
MIDNVLVIGHKGAMGGYFWKKFRSLDVKLNGIDQPIELSNIEDETKKADMIFLCVPAQAIKDVILTLNPFLKQDAIMVDICSVKVMPMKVMLNNYKGPVVGTHPLFGPSPDPHFPLRVAMVKGRGEKEFYMVENFLKLAGFITFECTAEEHDSALAFIQGLNFVTTLSYFAAFSGDESIMKFITPSFKRRFDSAKKMLTEDAYLFQNLFESNPFSHEAVKRFRSFLNLASAGDLDLLIQKAWWWWRMKIDGEDGS